MSGESADPRTWDQKALFRLLEDCLQDERRLDPRMCPVCFLALPHILQGNSPDLPALQTQHHGLWDACMRNLAVFLSVEELGMRRCGLQRNIDNCTLCGPSQHAALLKGCGKSHIADPLELFRILLCLCLANCLYGIDTSTGNTRNILNRAEDPRKRFRSQKGAWPTTVDQLFPYGPSRTVKALVMTTLWLPDDSPLIVLNAILHLARPRVWGALFEGDHHVALIWALLSMAIYGIGSVPLPSSHPALQYIPSPPPPRDAAWLREGRALHASAGFLHTIHIGPYARPDDILQFLAPNVTGFEQMFTVALDESRIPGPRQSDWTVLVMSLLTASDYMAQARERVSDEVVLRTVEKKPRTKFLSGVIYSALCSYNRSCAGPGCTRTILDHDDPGRSPLPTCAQCKVMRYCATNCQRSDWRHGDIPHKRLCPVLAAMQVAADFNLASRAEYAQRLLKSSIPDDYLALAARWALSTGQYCMDNVRCDIAFPGMFV